MSGRVDLDLLKARHEQGRRLSGPEVLVLDRVALRKSWARRGQATYWVDLLHHPPTQLWQVLRLWRWLDKKKSPPETVEGSAVSCDPTTHRGIALNTFHSVVYAQLGNDYLLDDRTTTDGSPSAYLTFDAPQIVERTPAVEQPQEPPLRRKPKFDVW